VRLRAFRRCRAVRVATTIEPKAQKGCYMHGSRSETLSVTAAAAYIEEMKGHRPNPATVFRWMQRGALQSFSIGRRRFTTRTAVQQLLESFNKPAPQAAAEPRADVLAAGEAAAARIEGLEG